MSNSLFALLLMLGFLPFPVPGTVPVPVLEILETAVDVVVAGFPRPP